MDDFFLDFFLDDFFLDDFFLDDFFFDFFFAPPFCNNSFNLASKSSVAVNDTTVSKSFLLLTSDTDSELCSDVNIEINLFTSFFP